MSEAPLSDEAKQNLHNFAVAIYEFLQSLKPYYELCVKHDKTTEAVNVRNGTLWLYKRYRKSLEIEGMIQRTLSAMDSWERSPWHSLSKGFESIKKRTERQHRPFACRGVMIDALPVLAAAWLDGDDLVVCTASPTMAIPTAGIVDFPLRRTATALKCHECLVPDFVGQPLPVERGRIGDYPIKAYLERTVEDRTYKGSPVVAMLDCWPRS